MKKKMLRCACLLCAVAMLFSVCACKKSPQEFSSVVVWEDEDDVSSTASANGQDASSNAGATDSSSSGTASQNTQSAKTTNLTRDQVMAQMPAKLRGTTIKYMSWDNPKKSVEKDAIAAFEKETGIKVEVEQVDLSKKFDILTARVAAGSAPDIFRTDEIYPSIVKNLQPIDNLNFNFNDKAWNWQMMHDFTFNGKTYGMLLQDTPFIPIALFFYNKAALKKAEMDNMDPYTIWKNNPNDWNWAKFWEICETFVNRNGNKDGYYGAGFSETYVYAYTRAFGLSNLTYDYKTNSYSSQLKNQKYVECMKTIADKVQSKAIAWQGAGGFEQGQILFEYNWSQNTNAGNIYYKNLKDRNNLGVVPIPTDSTATLCYQHYMLCIPVGAKNPEAVPYFVRYIQDRKGYNLDTLYAVPNSQEVIEWTLDRAKKQQNLFVGSSVHNYSYIHGLLGADSSQTKKFCDSFAATFEATAKKNNKDILALK